MFRIGINLGDIIIDEADIFGDGVNVAARLEGLADPGGICVSRIVRDQVRDKLGFGFEDMGQRQVKNIARPVHVFRIPLDAPARRRQAGTASRRSAPSRRGLAPSRGRRRRGGDRRRRAAVLEDFGRPRSGPGCAGRRRRDLFRPGQGRLSQSAGAALGQQQADFLQANPGVKVTVKTYLLG